MSHDRYFLRRVATRVATIKDGVVTDYQGDYEVRRGAGVAGWVARGSARRHSLTSPFQTSTAALMTIFPKHSFPSSHDISVLSFQERGRGGHHGGQAARAEKAQGHDHQGQIQAHKNE